MKVNRYYVVATIILLMIIAALALVNFLGSPAPLAFCTPAAGIITFFVLLAEKGKINSTTGTSPEKLRHAIAAAVVVQYLVLVGIVSYFINGAEKLPPITETMLTSFTTVTSVVVAFYFGASAFVDSKSKSEEIKDASPNTDK